MPAGVGGHLGPGPLVLVTVRRPAAALAATAVLGVLSAAPAPASATAHADGPDCAEVTIQDTSPRPVRGENPAYEAMHVPQAHDLAARAGVRPGAGVAVVVVDSGTVPSETLESSHGVIASRIVVGRDQADPRVPVGIAPHAQLAEANYYAVPRGSADADSTTPMADPLAAALDSVRGRIGSGLPRRTVVLVPAEVDPSPRLRRALRRLVGAGALVVAPAGDRPGEDDTVLGDYAGEPRPGEDAVADVWPAADPGVVSVGISDPEARGVALRNSGVDLSAPGGDTVSYGINGAPCVVRGWSTHWAAAQVAGVAALVWSVHEEDDAATLRRRLEATATGNGERSSPLHGYGAVQPVEALQRQVDQVGSDMSEGEVVERARPPRERADVLARTRDDAVWWGLAGGVALAVLLVLRPVLARRRR